MPVSPGVSADWAQMQVPDAAPVFTGMANMFASIGMAMTSVEQGNREMQLEQQRLAQTDRANMHRETMDILKANADAARLQYQQGIEAMRIGLEVEKTKLELRNTQMQIDGALGKENMAGKLPGLQSMFDQATMSDDYYGMVAAHETLSRDPDLKYSPAAQQTLVDMQTAMSRLREYNSQETISVLAKNARNGDLVSKVRLLPLGASAADAAQILHQDPELASKYTPSQLEAVVQATRSFKAFTPEQDQEYRAKKAVIEEQFDTKILQALGAGYEQNDSFVADLQFKKATAIERAAWEIRNPGKVFRPGIDSADTTKQAITAEGVTKDGERIAQALHLGTEIRLTRTLLGGVGATELVGTALELYPPNANPAETLLQKYRRASTDPNLSAKERAPFQAAMTLLSGRMDAGNYDTLRTAVYRMSGRSDLARDLYAYGEFGVGGERSVATASQFDAWSAVLEGQKQGLQLLNQEYATSIAALQAAVDQQKSAPGWATDVQTAFQKTMSAYEAFASAATGMGMPPEEFAKQYPSPNRAFVDQAWWKYFRMQLTPPAQSVTPPVSSGATAAAGPTGRQTPVRGGSGLPPKGG